MRILSSFFGRCRLGVIISVFACCFSIVDAQEFSIGDLGYRVVNPDSKEVRVFAAKDNIAGDIVIPEKVVYNNIEYSVTRIMEQGFEKKSGINSIVIPNSVRVIEHSAFRSCKSLRSIVMGNSVRVIDDYAFQNALANESALSSIDCPIVLSNTLSHIGSFAFSINNLGNSIRIPRSLVSVGTVGIELDKVNHVFSQIDRPDTMYVTGGETEDPSIILSLFYGEQSSTVLHVPKGTADIYRNALEWEFFPMIIEDVDETDPLPIVYPEKIEFKKSVITLPYGKTIQLKPVFTPSNTTVQDLAWFSNDIGFPAYPFIEWRESGNTKFGDFLILDYFTGEVSNSDCYTGDYTITAKTIDGSNLTATCIVRMVNEEEITQGDVNGDGVADIDDVNEIINTILTKDKSSNCDLNNDGSVDVDDLNIVINAILGKKH